MFIRSSKKQTAQSRLRRGKQQHQKDMIMFNEEVNGKQNECTYFVSVASWVLLMTRRIRFGLFESMAAEKDIWRSK